MMEEVAATALAQQIAALLNRPDSRPDLPGYDLPVLLICGREDRLTPLVWHEEMAGLIPGARLAVIEECAHMSTMERAPGGHRLAARLAALPVRSGIRQAAIRSSVFSCRGFR